MQADTCGQCGSQRDECSSPEHSWYPQRNVDYAAMAQAAAQWKYEELHKDAPYHDGSFESWAKERSMFHPFHYSDGVSIWVSRLDLTPDDDFI